MELTEFAEGVLYSPRLQDKLWVPQSLSDAKPKPKRPWPKAPAREAGMGFVSDDKAPPFPKLHAEASARDKGELLHRFANHELMAMELMAATLLAFPDAPPRFRMELAVALTEEQDHLQRYLAEMQRLGVELGELPLSDLFWKSLVVDRPLDFVTQMSLTFEQANLDFAKDYAERFEAIGETACAAVLQQILRDEISHVRLGVRWFSRWTSPDTPLWERYLAELPRDLSPSRGRGPVFLQKERRQAGLPEAFIHEMRLLPTFRGAAPRAWLFNPSFEADLRQAQGAPSQVSTRLSRSAEAVVGDLEAALILLAGPDDLLLLRRPYSKTQVAELEALGIPVPVLQSHAPALLEHPQALAKTLKNRPLSAIRSWGDTPAIRALQAELALAQPSGPSFDTLQRIASKPFSQALLADYLDAHPKLTEFLGPFVPGRAIHSPGALWTELGAAQSPIRIKRPLMSSGRGQMRLVGPPTPAERERLAAWLESDGELWIESDLDRVRDFGLEFWVTPQRARPKAHLLQLLNHPSGAYLGHRLSHPLEGLPPSLLRRLNAIDPRGLSGWLQGFSTWLNRRLLDVGYEGLLGVDMMLYREQGEVYLRPIVEINLRYTMGHIAERLRTRIAPKSTGLWLQLPVKGPSDAVSRLTELRAHFGQSTLQHGGRCKIVEAAFSLNDPEQTQKQLSVVVISPDRAAFDRISPWLGSDIQQHLRGGLPG